MTATALPDEILARFQSETLERLERMEAGWAALVQQQAPCDGDVARDLRRDLHTIKGDARIVGYGDVHFLCHKLEDLTDLAQLLGFRVPEPIDLVTTMAFQLLGMLVRQRGEVVRGIDVRGFAVQVEEALQEARSSSVQPVHRQHAWTRNSTPGFGISRLSAATQERLADAATQVFAESLSAPPGARERLYDVWLTLATELRSLTSVSLKQPLAAQAQGMIELGRELGKPVDIELAVTRASVPVRVVQTMKLAALHLLRNAVDHGIEPADIRRAHGKPAMARIRVEASVSSRYVELSVVDDGAGIDWAAVHRAAVRRKLRAAGDATDVRALTEILFHPSFSTRSEPGDVSGRAVGLDAVRSAVEREGGWIELESRLGEGTTVKVTLPAADLRTSVRRVDLGAGLIVAFRDRFDVTEEPAGTEPGLTAAQLLPGASAAPSRTSSTLVRLRGEGVELLVCGSLIDREPVVAHRICPVSYDRPMEVVLVKKQEVLALNPGVVGRP